MTHHFPPPPPEFVEQVKRALEHLYDFSYLQRLPLAQALAPAKRRPSQTLGHHLRRELLTAVEAISPDLHPSPQSTDARLYNLLQLRYVEAITVQEVANRMGLSARQAHRSLRRGEESVVAILWAKVEERRAEREKRPLSANEKTESAREISSVASEISLLETHLQPMNVREFLQDALKAIKPLADAHNLQFDVIWPDELMTVSADTAVSQQIFISLFSRITGVARQEPLTLRLHRRQDQILLTLSYTASKSAHPPILDEVITQLINRLGWTIRQEQTINGRSAIVLNLTGQGALILVIDDNEGLVEMLNRYLTGHQCRVLTATNGPEGLQLAQEFIPDAIILDVMMPGASGWEILQTLRSQPQTATVPVIVCSVFNDPDLAYSLGATRFHAKPIRRDTILDTLHELDVV
ncbi:MAG: response regulator [Chloroflexi bacterium]|nr:response regulator [Chloroflexota bacterium]